MALVVYIDYVIFGGPWAIAVWAISKFLPGFEAEPFWVKLSLFTALELVLHGLFRWSPGQFVLGVVEASRSTASLSLSGAPLSTKRTYLVDPSLKMRERWWTVLVGVLLILEGAKSIARWTMFTPPIPWFGVVPPAAVSAALFVLVGLAEIVLGAGVLRMRRFIFTLGLALYGTVLASNLISWSQWPDWTRRYVLARRAFQGTPVREGELETMQTITPVLMVVAPVILLLLVLLVYWRVRRLDAMAGNTAFLRVAPASSSKEKPPVTDKEQLEELMNEGIPIAEKMLREDGEFSPFGAVRKSDDSIELVSVLDGLEEPLWEDQIELLNQLFRSYSARVPRQVTTSPQLSSSTFSSRRPVAPQRRTPLRSGLSTAPATASRSSFPTSGPRTALSSGANSLPASAFAETDETSEPAWRMAAPRPRRGGIRSNDRRRAHVPGRHPPPAVGGPARPRKLASMAACRSGSRPLDLLGRRSSRSAPRA